MGRSTPVPVAIDVAGPMRGQVERVVEGVLGWQVVAVDDPVLPARCVLVDVERATAHASGGLPVVLLVGRDDDALAVGHAARHASVVVDGVPDAAVLARVAAQTAAAAPSGRAPWCAVAAAAGGVGATTVATALGGLRAWRHGRTLVAVVGPTHQEGAPSVTPADLASPAVWAAAVPTAGVPGCRVVGLHAAAAPSDAGAVPLVVEVGTGTTPADVLVVRPDRAGLTAAATATGTVVVVGRGAITARRLRDATPDAQVICLPWSARVAGAAARSRLPADLPGTWLQPLAAIVDRLQHRSVA